MRLENWVEKMFIAIEAHSNTPFEWGKNDCCLFAARVVDAMTNGNFEDVLKANYSDEKSAISYIASHGSLEAAVSSHLGAPTPGRAIRGDVVLCKNEGTSCLGICVGTTVACLGKNGPVYLTRSDILIRWAI